MDASFTTPEAGVEPVPGYCLSQRLGRGAYGDVWCAYAPGGFQVAALKFVPLADARGMVELKALDVIRDIRHPNLLVTFAAWQVESWLIIGMELADMTLMDRFRQAKEQELVGIPRDELLDYFQEASRGIDFLNEPRHGSGGVQRFAIQHRDLKPQNILLVGSGVKVADFGLARLMNEGETGHSGGMTPAYAAPEFFKGQTTSSSDQYCLAVTYCKLRGGLVPFDGTLSEIMVGHLSQPPDLKMIPPAEQAVVARALSKEPKDRWPSCRAFVQALVASDNVPRVKGLVPISTIPYSGVPATDGSSCLLGSPEEASATFVLKRPDVGPAASLGQGDLGPSARPNTPSLPGGDVFQAAREKSKKTFGSWVIGRESKCNLVVNHSAVSGQHCRLTETAQGYLLEDLGSANGTYVNGHRIKAAVHIVTSDQVTLGQSAAMPWPSVSHSGSDVQVIEIGRDRDNHVVLDYPTVSGRHARIIVLAGVAHIEDLGSTNGIAIGQPEAKVQQGPLGPNDIVYFGSLAVPAARLLGAGAKEAVQPKSVTFRGQPLVLGRDSSCDQLLDFPTISGRHARLWQDGGRILIDDLGSTNGTFVNGQRIYQRTVVKAKDLIGLGSITFQIHVKEGTGAA